MIRCPVAHSKRLAFSPTPRRTDLFFKLSRTQHKLKHTSIDRTPWNSPYLLTHSKRIVFMQLSMKKVAEFQNPSKLERHYDIFHPSQHPQKQMIQVQPFLLASVSQIKLQYFGWSFQSWWFQVWDTHPSHGDEPKPELAAMGCSPSLLPFH